MYQIRYTARMKKDVRRMKRRGKDIEKLINVLNMLSLGEALPENLRDHQLTGNLRDFRECHIEPDWLLIYQIDEDILILSAMATGSHTELFRL